MISTSDGGSPIQLEFSGLPISRSMRRSGHVVDRNVKLATSGQIVDRDV